MATGVTTPAGMDSFLWQEGHKTARNPGQPGELDFLRGIHDPVSLHALKTWLVNSVGFPVRLVSVWLDKYGYVIPDPPILGASVGAKQEVADLAIVVRDATTLDWLWMWLLQGKVTQAAGASLPSAGSTAKEIVLFEQMPEFTWSGAFSTGKKFNLKLDFTRGVASYRHWSFLCFESPPAYGPAPPSPYISARWTGSSSSPTETSFCGELVTLVRAASGVAGHPGSPYGAPLRPNPEWDALATEMYGQVLSVPSSGHASRTPGQQAPVEICALMATMSENFPPIPLTSGLTTALVRQGISQPIPNAISTGFYLEQAVQVGAGGGDGPPRNIDNVGDDDGGGLGPTMTLFVDLLRPRT